MLSSEILGRISKEIGKPADSTARKSGKAYIIGEGEDAKRVIVKVVNKKSRGYSQIDKRYAASYRDTLNMPLDVIDTLQRFAGEKGERKKASDFKEYRIRRMEVAMRIRQKRLAEYLFDNADYLAVVHNGEVKTVSIEDAVKLYSQGEIAVGSRGGTFRVGGFAIQRKGGDSGEQTSSKLQIKFNPLVLFGEQTFKPQPAKTTKKSP